MLNQGTLIGNESSIESKSSQNHQDDRWAEISRSVYRQNDNGAAQSDPAIQNLQSLLAEKAPSQEQQAPPKNKPQENPGDKVSFDHPKKLEPNNITDTPGIFRGYYKPGDDKLIATDQDKEASKRHQEGTDKQVTIDDLNKLMDEQAKVDAKRNRNIFQEIADAWRGEPTPPYVNEGTLIDAADARKTAGAMPRAHNVYVEDFFDVVEKNHSKIDANQDAKITQDELKNFVNRNDIDVHAKEVGTVLLEKFDQIETMHEGHMPLFYGKGTNTRPRFSMFERDSNYISPEDLVVFHHGALDAPFTEKDWRDRNAQKQSQGALEWAGASLIGTGAVAGYLGGAVATFPWGLAAAGVALGAHALWTGGFSSKGPWADSPKVAIEGLKSESKIHELNKELKTWNYFALKRDIDRYHPLKTY